MRHRLRSVVWRELPYSARRGIVGVLRAIDDFENFWIRIWQSLHYSPAWLAVAVLGSIGILLTILLFCLLTQELFAGTQRELRQPIIDAVVLAPQPKGLIDARLCLDTVPAARSNLPADFLFDGELFLASGQELLPRRAPSRRISAAGNERFADPAPVIEELPVRSQLPPDLEVVVDLWRRPMGPEYAAGPAQVLMAHSAHVAGGPLGQLSRTVADGWTWYRERPVAEPTVARPYRGEGNVTAVIGEEEPWDDFRAWPAQADVALRLELHNRGVAAVQRDEEAILKIENTGRTPVRRLEVREDLHALDMVTGATPPAELQNGELYRRLLPLGAGSHQQVVLEWSPQSLGTQRHQAHVLAEVFVGAYAEVTAAPARIAVEPVPEVTPPIPDPIDAAPEPVPEPTPVNRPAPRRRPAPQPTEEPTPEPAVVPETPDFEAPPAAQKAPELECQIAGAAQVHVNGIAEFEINVRNTGDVPLTAVRIWADLPANLRHKYGDRLELAIGDLPSGEVRHATLRVVGDKPGLSRARIQAVSTEAESRDAEAVLAVVARRPVPGTTQPPATPGCDCRCQNQVTWRAGF